MPLTPFHLGPALLLGVSLRRRLDLPTLLAGSVLVDVRAALVVFGPLDPPVHGILTTFAGGTVVAVALGAAIAALPGRVQEALDRGRLGRTGSTGPIVAGALAGVYSHVVLDALLYTDVEPFYPLAGNPFLVGDFALVYGGCVVAGLLGVAIATVRRSG